MALFFTTPPYLLSLTSQNSINKNPVFNVLRANPNPLSFLPRPPIRPLRLVRSSLSSSSSEPESESASESDTNADTVRIEPLQSETAPLIIADEWGEKSEPVAESEPATKLADSDPPRNEDEWEENQEIIGGDGGGNGIPVFDPVVDLKRCLVDTVYGSELGFRAGPDVRGEVLELVNQLEALNPTPEPVENPELLDGNWILLYTAFSELLPLLAAGATPLLKVDSISQSIDTSNFSIVNSTKLSSPFATFSFSATAAFEVRSASRIQVSFKEGAVQPPEIKPTIDIPENIDIFGQNFSLSPLQQALNPIQEVAANVSRAISGQPPLKLPIPGDRSSSWLLITYLDKDLRISRGDGGLFVLAREGSDLLEQ